MPYNKKDITTIYSVAREAGVSRATVSRVVNGNPNVKDATRKRVLDAILQLGYRPNAVARGLACRKTMTVGVVLPDISQSLYAELMRGIEDVANVYKYGVFINSSDLCQERELRSIEIFLERRVDGLLFLGNEITSMHRSLFKSMDVPVVLMAMSDKLSVIPCVSVDELKMTQEAVSMLLSEGHKKLGFMRTLNYSGHICEQGYRMTLLNRGFVFNTNLVLGVGLGYISGYDGMQFLLAQNPNLTAVLIAHNSLIPGAINAILDTGRLIPRDIAFVGFSDPIIKDQVRPLVSYVGASVYDIGAAAMYLLVQYINKIFIAEKSILIPYRMDIHNSMHLDSQEIIFRLY